ncbi:hypothetical protein HMPREF1565_1144 [Providencia alcalifaciens RIMD 1656011]|uniref:Uncharacterized protein n=2 Tax=Providencia alcalifaciens TaxID=126385 RepID=B6XD73_9GAMM|nr:hypothetical protein PROVALCAL_01295 [Providencia alcalifaciens DSM 30120]ETT06694.1 hypothetical protein HMPREF1562_4194 [Providencia alcalifaciens F90-2004]EUC95392.1 hypothetical protein HMPREF1567_3955 [Providencia alcalifaciens PAL-2]EUD05245.1 hypothetical protein HMPREF1565_1144 [Providencia alcalifaciens RIMD 1656011]EUD05683.1 hypothetical protein HMPREF1564_2326 [Providencia alcalifaciens R90-1475]EUD12826.1 hypothetical protein HMPREF1563_2359 [Providencia alcalifaciens 205/92]
MRSQKINMTHHYAKKAKRCSLYAQRLSAQRGYLINNLMIILNK